MNSPRVSSPRRLSPIVARRLGGRNDAFAQGCPCRCSPVSRRSRLRLPARRRSTRSRSAPTGWRRPSTAASTRRWPTAPTSKYGLDVTIVPGGPNVNNRILLPVGKIDFFLSANTLQSFDAVEQNIPTIAVAAMFQKDPQVLIAHPDQGIEKFEDLKKLHAVRLQGRHGELLPVAQGRLRLQGRRRSSPTPSMRSRSSPTRNPPCRAM